MKALKVALIGSRDLSKSVNKPSADLFYKVAYQFAINNFIMRSGVAIGADQIARQAYVDAIEKNFTSPLMLHEFFAAQKHQDECELPYAKLAIVPSKEIQQRSFQIVKDIHPKWDELSYIAKALHGRNANQILGANLDSPVDLVVCWTRFGQKIGGTRTAIVLAEQMGIPVFNLGKISIEQELKKLESFVINNLNSSFSLEGIL